MIFFGSVESVDGGLVTRVLCVTSCVCIYVVRCMHSFLRRCWWFIVVQLSTYVLRKHRLLKVVVYACLYILHTNESENWKRFDDEQCSQRIGNDLTTNTKLWCMPVCICCTENAQGSQELKRVTQNWCSQRIGNDLTTNTKLLWIPVCIHCTKVTIVQSIAQRERCSGLGQCVYVQPVLANNMCWFWCPCEEQWHKR